MRALIDFDEPMTPAQIADALGKVRRQFPNLMRNRPYRRREISVHVSYGKGMELRMLVPPELDERASGIILPIRDIPITDLPDLLARIRATP